LAATIVLGILTPSVDAQRGFGELFKKANARELTQGDLGAWASSYSREDGRLEVREVFGLDLHARLVVLSACETGLGTLSRGDEIVGLQRAFLYAGTPAVVTTL
jgi:hypothetical protein